MSAAIVWLEVNTPVDANNKSKQKQNQGFEKSVHSFSRKALFFSLKIPEINNIILWIKEKLAFSKDWRAKMLL